jgi:hypothetical protein
MAFWKTCSVAKLSTALLLGITAPLIQGSLGFTADLNARLLAAHNRERASAGVPGLEWDSELAAGAAKWGRYLARSGGFDHSPEALGETDGEPVGENLFMGTKGAYGPEAMIASWIEEKRNFRSGAFPDNSRTGSFEDVGHYTQLMWRATLQVSCAVVANAQDDVLVCRYAEPGNVDGEEPF